MRSIVWLRKKCWLCLCVLFVALILTSFISLACLFQDKKAWTSGTQYVPRPFLGGHLLNNGLRMISSWQLKLSQMAGRSERQLRNSECQSLLSMIRVSVRVAFGAKSGPPRYLTDGEEKELSNFLVGCSRIGYARSRKQVISLVGGIVAKKTGRKLEEVTITTVVEFLQETSPTTDSANCKPSCLLTCCYQ